MAQLFGIELLATLNEDLSATEIQGKIDEIEKGLKPIKVDLGIDDSALKTLESFNKNMKELESTAKRFQTAMAGGGGSSKKIDNQIPVERLKELGKEFPKVETAMREQGKSLKELGDGFTRVTKETEKFEGAGKQLVRTLDLVDESGHNLRRISMNLETGKTVTTDTAGLEKERKEIQNINNLRQQGLKYIENQRVANRLTTQEAEKYNSLLSQANSRKEIQNVRDQANLQLNQRRTMELEKQIALQQQSARHNLSMLDQGLYGNMSDEHRRQLTNIIGEMDKITTNTPHAARRLNELNREFSQTAAQVRHADQGMARFNKQLISAMLRVPIYAGVMAALYAPFNAIRDALQQIIDIDSQMTVLERVSNGMINAGEAMEDSIEIAEKLGNRIAEVNEGLIAFARQGYRGADLTAIAEVATVMSNVSDLNVEESASSLTAAMKGFNIEAENSIRIVDALNEVDRQNMSLMLAIA